MELFKLLEKYTNSEFGSYTLNYNEHHSEYINKANEDGKIDEDRLINHYIFDSEEDVEQAKDLKELDLQGNIYELYWYNNTQVGNYIIYGNSIEELTCKVKILIEKNRDDFYERMD